MVLPRVLLLVLTLLSTLSSRAADEPWSKLKPGMTPAETARALGTSLFSSRGRGFEIGIYEGKAEVVFLRDQLVAWTGPVGQPGAPTPPMAAFQFNQQWRPLPAARVFERPSAPVYERRRGSFLPAYRL